MRVFDDADEDPRGFWELGTVGVSRAALKDELRAPRPSGDPGTDGGADGHAPRSDDIHLTMACVEYRIDLEERHAHLVRVEARFPIGGG